MPNRIRTARTRTSSAHTSLIPMPNYSALIVSAR